MLKIKAKAVIILLTYQIRQKGNNYQLYKDMKGLNKLMLTQLVERKVNIA